MRQAVSVFSVFLIAAFFSLFAFARTARAIRIFMPFGGKVEATEIKGITCDISKSDGPIVIIPKNFAPPGPYAAPPTVKRYDYKKIKKGVWIIGLYSPVPTPLCRTETEPPIPVPVFPIVLYGVSQ